MIIGSQNPAYSYHPLYLTTAGDDAIDLYHVTGRVLDDSQQEFLRHGLGEDKNGRWTSFFNCLIECRQNGKGAVIEARELAGALLFKEKKIIHSSHRFDTSIDAFQKMRNLLRDTPQLLEFVEGYDGNPDAPAIRGFRSSHGQESIRFKNGAAIEYRTRANDGGRGYTVDGALILDEAFALSKGLMGDIIPTVSATTMQGNPQIWLMSSAGKASSEVLRQYRDRGRAGGDEAGRLNYMEFCAKPEDIEEYGADSPIVWAQANPALGRRIALDYVAEEFKSMPLAEFMRERLGVWDEPADENTAAISEEAWDACLRESSKTSPDSLVFSVDIPPSRESASICVASELDDGTVHIEVVEQGLGTGWLAQRLSELVEAYPSSRVLIDAGGATGALLNDFRHYRVRCQLIGMREYAQACGMLFDAVMAGSLAHIGQRQLTEAVNVATVKPLGDSLWKWNRKNQVVDISPLVGCTIAFYGVKKMGKSRTTGKSGGSRVMVL